MTQTVPAIDRDAHCIHCGYNLRGLNEDGRCPECGNDIRRSLGRMEHLHNADPRWLQAAAAGMLLYLLGALLWAAGLFSLAAMDLRSSGTLDWPALIVAPIGPRPSFVAYSVGMAVVFSTGSYAAIEAGIPALLMLLQWVGIFLFTRPEPGNAERPGPLPRRRLRRLLILSAVAGVALFPAGMLNPWLMFLPGAVLAICDVSAMLQLHWLAADLVERIQRYGLAKNLRITGGILTALAVLTIVMAVIGFGGGAGPVRLGGGCALVLVAVASLVSLVCFWKVWRCLRAAARARTDV